MKATIDLINTAIAAHPRACLAFSGGTDSRILVELTYRETAHRPPLLYASTGLDFPETEDFVRQTAADLGAALIVSKPSRTPEEQWAKQGWPMIGKANAHEWNRSHSGRGFGFKASCTACCRAMKIGPARKAMKAHGLELQLTGLRGTADSQGRGLRALKDGLLFFHKADKVWICNPMTGWTDTMLRRFVRHRGLRLHPRKYQGAETIGCVTCGGGAQFTGSVYPHTRRLWPEAWHRFIVDQRGGPVILAIKYDQPLRIVDKAIEESGGLAHLARTKPWLFDFIRDPPMAGYDKETGGLTDGTPTD